MQRVAFPMCVTSFKGGVGHVAPAHAALDGPLRKAGVRKERAAQARVLYRLERGVCTRHGFRIDHVIVLVRQDFTIVVGKRLVDEWV